MDIRRKEHGTLSHTTALPGAEAGESPDTSQGIFQTDL